MSHTLEHELLLLCSRTRYDSTQAERVREILCGPVDWTYILHWAGRHGVKVLLYRSLNTICPEFVPRDILVELKNNWLMLSCRNIQMSMELIKVLQLFERNNIIALPFKGPVLTEKEYGHIGLRNFSDLDIFIHQSDLEKVHELLQVDDFYAIDESTQVELHKSYNNNYHRVYKNEKKQLWMEIHWDIIASHFRYSPNFNSILKNKSEIRFFNGDVSVFKTEDNLLLLCIHGMKHIWEKMIWICDVAELLRNNQDISWNYLIAQAEGIGSKRTLWLGLLLARDLLGAQIPEAIERQARADRNVIVAFDEVCRVLFTSESTVLSPSEITYDILGQLRMRKFCLRLKDQWFDKLKTFISMLLYYLRPRKIDVDTVTLPSWLGFCYYILRPIRIAGVLLDHHIKSR